LIAALHHVIKLSNDGVHASIQNGGDYSDNNMSFHVVEIVQQPRMSRGTPYVRIRVIFKHAAAGWKIYTSDAEWVTPGKDPISLDVPFEKPATQ
jgi:hypothetical protein